jgi:16S rRNA (cytosine1402-N4)-methyltransferase
VNGHVAVLLDEAIDALAVRAGGLYVDATYGRGGHSRAILAALGPQGRLLALDRDPQAVMHGRELQRADSRFGIEQESFGSLRRFLDMHGAQGGVDGILFDLGVSSPQFDAAARGFSFQSEGPLDMRMDPASSPSAAEWLASATEREIATVLRRYGEERAAGRIARAIVARRATAPLVTTTALAALVVDVLGRMPGERHPATRVFQAIRIHVNRELEQLQAALAAARDALAAGGRLVVISFHSLEDRIVKRFMRDHSRVDPALARLPVVPAAAQPVMRLVDGPVHPSAAEVARNPRARSAVLRVAERLG